MAGLADPSDSVFGIGKPVVGNATAALVAAAPDDWHQIFICVTHELILQTTAFAGAQKCRGRPAPDGRVFHDSPPWAHR